VFLERPVQGTGAEDLRVILFLELLGAIDQRVGQLGVLVIDGNTRAQIGDKQVFGNRVAVCVGVSVQEDVPGDGASIRAEEKISADIEAGSIRAHHAIDRGRRGGARPMDAVPKSSGRFNPVRNSAPALAKVLTVPRAIPACGSTSQSKPLRRACSGQRHLRTSGGVFVRPSHAA